jgi:4-alpha-glucanotransferase
LAKEVTVERKKLSALATAYGVQIGFTDVWGRRRNASREALLAVLRGLGAPLEKETDLPAALRQRRRSPWRRVTEPVTVAWEGRPVEIVLRLPSSASSRRVRCRVVLESGESRRHDFTPRDLGVVARASVGGTRMTKRRLALPGPWPVGRHRVVIEWGGRSHETLVLRAPRRAWTGTGENGWGVFAPVYALHSGRDQGCGDLADLASLGEWVHGLGGRTVATLPMLAAFLDEPCEPSPYAPVSRLFWNELYLDVTAVADLRDLPEARRLVRSAGFRRTSGQLRSGERIDYRAVMAHKRRVLEKLSGAMLRARGSRRDAFERFRRRTEGLTAYARFRAAVEKRGRTWRQWPSRMRDGRLRRGDWDDRVAHYHEVVQWLISEQLGKLASGARSRGVELLLDLPLGVHPDGFDVWREGDLFAEGVSAGAPPDDFFPLGQDWGFPPVRPDRSREQEHRHLLACLRNHLRFAGALRIDHVMSLHRLFWVPAGFPAAEGVYVRYPAEELYALLCLESHRHRSVIVGEDLGTVPSYVRSAMERRGILRSYALQAALPPDARGKPAPVPASAVAGLNTHDMPTFSGFWRGLDIRDRVELGLLDPGRVDLEDDRRRRRREALVGELRRRGHLRDKSGDARAVLRGSLGFLAESPARTVLVNLEDLWLERRPQNVPGTTTERPNWRRRTSHSMEAFSDMTPVRRLLGSLDRHRGRGTERP